VEERGEREDGEDLGKILAWMGSGLFSLSHFSNSNKAMAETFPRVVLTSKCMVRW
jgi:hypothetical protein